MKKEIIYFKNDKYECDGKNLWRNGELVMVDLPPQVKLLREINVIKVDNYIFDGEKWYKEL